MNINTYTYKNKNLKDRKLKRKRKQKRKRGSLREGREAPPRRCPHPFRFCFRSRFNCRFFKFLFLYVYVLIFNRPVPVCRNTCLLGFFPRPKPKSETLPKLSKNVETPQNGKKCSNKSKWLENARKRPKRPKHPNFVQAIPPAAAAAADAATPRPRMRIREPAETGIWWRY